MPITEIFPRIQMVIAQYLERDPGLLSRENKISDLEADSLDLIEIILRLEDEFDLDFPDQELMQLHTIDDLNSLIIRLLQS